MKNNLIKYLFFTLFAFPLFISAQNLPERPSPPKLVNDFVGMLSATEVQQLERKLVDFNDSTSTQIAIVIVNSIGDYEVSDFAVQLAQKWGVGQKGSDNGILILITKESRDSYIVTGYGMEAYVPDILASEIIQNQIIPNFKNQQYYQGLDEATTVIMDSVKGVYKGTGANKKGVGGIKTMLLIGVILFLLFFSRKGGGGGGRTFYGGGFGGGFGGGGSSGGSSFGGFGGGGFGGGGAGGKW